MHDIRNHAQRYFTLAADPDQAGYLAQFADDAVVEDEDRLHQGRAALAAWRTDLPRVTYTPLDVDPLENGYVARAEIAGDFPGSPVTLTFTVGLDGDGAIRSLTIRP